MMAGAGLRLPRPLLLAALLPLAMALSWAVGFAWFLHKAAAPSEPPPQADGIVALTGGAERVETALRLLARGQAQKLLVSGVGRAAEFVELAHRAGVDPALSGRVTLGRAAASTRGNATETADWAHSNDIHTLIVVTAGYHMPRAMAELSRTLPEVALYPVPVQPPALRGWPGLAALRLLAGEYTKWLAAEIGLSSLASRAEERAAARSAGHAAPRTEAHPPAQERRGG
ncbi:YdcF family protein [Limobrevibacterium gyesilva]|uniref:YdcF family protein n=1 Tax=Limobrevibacterium gyesilva TaxID=2991712 RepID=A0AA42CHY5_9PROT|nr:YdcF family protein [Limobrevibacterium gyesilva]MCW3477766.1 YdcF family protein [Limobrevibacterium gyesilva]